MNSIVRPSLLLLFALASLNAAELPKKAMLSRYAPLWDSSPFTTKPPPPPSAPEVNPFEDWALKGVAPIAGGYYITLINKKKPGEAVPPIDTDKPSEFKVLRVERDPDNAFGTTVYLSKGAMTGSVTYDEKLSIPKAPVAKAGHKLPGQAQIPGQPPLPQIQPVAPSIPPNQMRPRVVPPPTTAAPQPATYSRGGSRGGSSSGGSSGSGRSFQRPSGR